MTPTTRFCVTGGIACGKSAVASCLAAAGVTVVDTDVIARELLEPAGAGYKKTVDAFGENILNNARLVDRTLLGRLVFADTEKRNLLNSILHPLIFATVEQRLSELDEQQPAVTVAPLLYEVGWETRFGPVLCVAVSPATQAARLRQRGLSDEEARQRLAAQLPQEEKIRRADAVLWNDGSRELLAGQVEILKNLWLNS